MSFKVKLSKGGVHVSKDGDEVTKVERPNPPPRVREKRSNKVRSKRSRFSDHRGRKLEAWRTDDGWACQVLGTDIRSPGRWRWEAEACCREMLDRKLDEGMNR